MITLRKLENCDKDYKLLEKWCQQEFVYSQFEQRKLTFDEIKTKYYPRTLENATVPVYIIEYDKIPLGIIQYKKIDDDNIKLYEITNKDSYEIDIFIGELDYHGKGIGKKSIDILSNYLFNEKDANLLVMCPQTTNKNAIKCYQGCGFVKKRNFIIEDTIGNLQEFVLMIKKNKRL